jgi:hypothetical protein
LTCRAQDAWIPHTHSDILFRSADTCRQDHQLHTPDKFGATLIRTHKVTLRRPLRTPPAPPPAESRLEDERSRACGGRLGRDEKHGARVRARGSREPGRVQVERTVEERQPGCMAHRVSPPPATTSIGVCRLRRRRASKGPRVQVADCATSSSGRLTDGERAARPVRPHGAAVGEACWRERALTGAAGRRAVPSTSANARAGRARPTPSPTAPARAVGASGGRLYRSVGLAAPSTE